MSGRSRKTKLPRDPNALAKGIVDQATASVDQEVAALLGSIGRRKGGIARAAKLSPKRRAEIARKAAEVRWMGSQGGMTLASKLSPARRVERARAVLDKLNNREQDDTRLLELIRERRSQLQQEDALLAQAEAKLMGQLGKANRPGTRQRPKRPVAS